MEEILVKEGVKSLLLGLAPLKPSRLYPYKALGHDERKGIRNRVRPCIFAHLFQQLLDSGEVHKEWSLANISPLYKRGEMSLACK